MLLLDCSGLSQAQEQEQLQLSHETKTYGVELAADKPEFAGFWVDSLGKGRKWTNGLLTASSKQTYNTSSENG